MFRRKLIALDYPEAPVFALTDEKFRETVLWLEDQKIRQYKIEDRENLRKFNSPAWTEAFAKYLMDIHCPYAPDHNKDVLMDWLLGYAVKLEYGDNVNALRDKTASMLLSDETEAKRKKVAQNPFDNLDFNDPTFKAGVDELAKLLNVPRHSDHLITLEGVCKLMQKRLSSAAVDEANKTPIPSGILLPLEKCDLGFDTGDKILDNAGRVLRLLRVHELRDLQTKINEIIVAVQNVTADPKVDDRLGKLGV